MKVIKKQNDELKETYTFKDRITKIEDENRSLRALMQQAILTLNASVKNALCQREVEETCLKLNFNMMDAIFGEDNFRFEKDNLEMDSQIKLNVIKWE